MDNAKVDRLEDEKSFIVLTCIIHHRGHRDRRV